MPNRLAELRAVARVRLGADFTQEALAKRLRVKRQTIAAWEKGTSEPSISQAHALARELGVTVDELGFEAQPIA